MSLIRALVLTSFSVFILACGGGDDAATPENGSSGLPAAAQKAIGDAESALDRHFDPELRKKACELLTPTMVAELLGVPEGELKQVKVMGCQYSWNSDTEAAWASLMMIKAHKDVPTAKTWFANSTKGMSKEDVANVMGDAKKKLEEEGELDTEPKKQAADMVGGALTAGAGKDGFKYQKLDGLGDEAAVGLSDGNVTVRVGNLMFTATGYKGAQKPPSKVKPDPKNLEAYTAKIMEEEREWVKATLEERKAYAKKVAEAVLAKL